MPMQLAQRICDGVQAPGAPAAERTLDFVVNAIACDQSPHSCATLPGPTGHGVLFLHERQWLGTGYLRATAPMHAAGALIAQLKDVVGRDDLKAGDKFTMTGFRAACEAWFEHHDALFVDLRGPVRSHGPTAVLQACELLDPADWPADTKAGVHRKADFLSRLHARLLDRSAHDESALTKHIEPLPPADLGRNLLVLQRARMRLRANDAACLTDFREAIEQLEKHGESAALVLARACRYLGHALELFEPASPDIGNAHERASAHLKVCRDLISRVSEQALEVLMLETKADSLEAVTAQIDTIASMRSLAGNDPDADDANRVDDGWDPFSSAGLPVPVAPRQVRTRPQRNWQAALTSLGSDAQALKLQAAYFLNRFCAYMHFPLPKPEKRNKRPYATVLELLDRFGKQAPPDPVLNGLCKLARQLRAELAGLKLFGGERDDLLSPAQLRDMPREFRPYDHVEPAALPWLLRRLADHTQAQAQVVEAHLLATLLVDVLLDPVRATEPDLKQPLIGTCKYFFNQVRTATRTTGTAAPHLPMVLPRPMLQRGLHALSTGQLQERIGAHMAQVHPAFEPRFFAGGDRQGELS